jgi:hypothetical protein
MTRSAATDSRTLLAAAIVGAIGWLGVVALGVQLASGSPPALGFDLELLLEAGRAVAAGRSPYAIDLIEGAPPTATDLFYSYPPPVAQAMALVAAVPSSVMIVLWAIGAVAGLLFVADGLRRRLAPERSRRVVLALVAAVAPLTLPFTVGLLFGNFDVYFPLLYGLMLLAVLDASTRGAAAGGIALVVASLKVHPASMGLWFLVRWLTHRAPGTLVVLGWAVVAGLAILGVSVLLGGVGLWVDYVEVVRSGTGAVIVDPRNAGPAALIASAIGADDATARVLHIGVAVIALAVTIWAGWRRSDPVESFGWATAASLATLPVTWYHYPSALLPIGIAAWLRAGAGERRRVTACLVAAEIVAAVALVLLPLLWVSIGLVILAARWSRPGASPAPAPAAG